MRRHTIYREVHTDSVQPLARDLQMQYGSVRLEETDYLAQELDHVVVRIIAPKHLLRSIGEFIAEWEPVVEEDHWLTGLCRDFFGDPSSSVPDFGSRFSF